MLGFYVLLEDPDANVIIALALHSALLQFGFFESHDLRYIADQPMPLASGEDAAANRRCWSSYIIHVNVLDTVRHWTDGRT